MPSESQVLGCESDSSKSCDSGCPRLPQSSESHLRDWIQSLRWSYTSTSMTLALDKDWTKARGRKSCCCQGNRIQISNKQQNLFFVTKDVSEAQVPLLSAGRKSAAAWGLMWKVWVTPVRNSSRSWTRRSFPHGWYWHVFKLPPGRRADGFPMLAHPCSWLSGCSPSHPSLVSICTSITPPPPCLVITKKGAASKR